MPASAVNPKREASMKSRWCSTGMLAVALILTLLRFRTGDPSRLLCLPLKIWGSEKMSRPRKGIPLKNGVPPDEENRSEEENLPGEGYLPWERKPGDRRVLIFFGEGREEGLGREWGRKRRYGVL